MKRELPDTIVFVTLAMNQTRFFLELGNAMKKAGYGIAFVSFHERSHERLVKEGEHSYNAFAFQLADTAQVDFGRYGIQNPRQLLEHEKAFYEVFESDRLLAKFAGHIHAMTAIFESLERDRPGRICVVQELGGVLSVLAAFYAAQARSIDTWFIEPSFFRGRAFFTKNTFRAPVVTGPDGRQASLEVCRYLEDTIRQQSVVIPAKDRRFYRGTIAKLTDTGNMRRLIEKVWDKHVLGKREEFEHVAGHVGRHLRMFFNNVRLKGRYRSIPEAGRFVYYPLHVPADFALTIRSPEWLNQYALIDYLCRIAPYTHRVAIKEHPARVGAMSHAAVADLMRRHDNLVLLDPSINNYEVLKSAEAVVTVNSKSGAEALLLGKPVVVLGDAFYRHSSLVTAVERPIDLPGALDAVLRSGTATATRSIHSYFQGIWDQTHPGELYDLSERNIAEFSESLLAVVGASARPAHEALARATIQGTDVLPASFPDG